MSGEPEAADFAGAVEGDADLGGGGLEVAGGRQPARELAAEDDIQADSAAVAGLDGQEAVLELGDSREQRGVEERCAMPDELEGCVGDCGYRPLQASVDGSLDGIERGAERSRIGCDQTAIIGIADAEDVGFLVGERLPFGERTPAVSVARTLGSRRSPAP